MDQNLPDSQNNNSVPTGTDQAVAQTMTSIPNDVGDVNQQLDLGSTKTYVNNLSQIATQVGNRGQSASDLLAGLAKGEIIDDVRVPFIIQGNKINNKLLRLYVLKLRQDHGWSDSKIIDALIVLDEMIEKGVLDATLLTDANDNN